MINLVPYELVKHIIVTGSECGTNHILAASRGTLEEKWTRKKKKEMKDWK